jgi:hypothetical protein
MDLPYDYRETSVHFQITPGRKETTLSGKNSKAKK